MDTYTRSSLDFPTRTCPTQGSIPFSATQSLKLCLPFQCSSRCAKKKNQPPWSVCEVPFHTRFIKLILPQFHSKPVHTKTRDAHTSKCKLWVWVKTFFNQKRMGKMEKSTPGWAIWTRQWLWALHEEKRLLWTPKSWILIVHLLSNQKTNFLAWRPW